jgi:putative ATP-binding cassette transporter
MIRTPPQGDPRDYQIDVRFFRRAIGLTHPYWARKGAWRSWLVAIAIAGIVALSSGFGFRLSFLSKEMTDALVGRHEASYWRLFLLTTLIGLAMEGSFLFAYSYLNPRLILHWRVFMTEDLLRRYLQRRTYFGILQEGVIDNVDQRIQQEVDPYCSMVSIMPMTIFGALLTMSGQGWILRQISPFFFYAVLVYGAVSAVVTWWLLRPLIRLNFQSTVAEADLRYGILHVRDYAETIALYRGEAAEERSIVRRLLLAMRIAIATLHYRLGMALANSGLGLVWTLMPAVILVPLFFSGKISYGVVTQGTVSAGLLLASLQQVISLQNVFAAGAPHVVRLAQIVERAQVSDAEERDQSSCIARHEGPGIRVAAMSLQTPGGERTLLHNLTLDIGAGRHLMIVGQTGVGKSSLLRALAGLWTRGSGSITMPPPDDVLFLPQRPYMLLANLREQILYPAFGSELDDAQLQTLLEQVSLPDLAAQHGGFDTVCDWARVLSLGEQQRIAFARALAARPRYVFLDEATSAVDMATERRLYELLRNSSVTFISVGHRPSLLQYHVDALDLLAGGNWRVIPAHEAMPFDSSLTQS